MPDIGLITHPHNTHLDNFQIRYGGVTYSDILVTERVWLFYKYIPTRKPQMATYFTQTYFQLVHDFDLIDTFTKPLSYNNKP